MDIGSLSVGMFMGLCQKIGTKTEVTIRRDAKYIHELINKPVQICRGQRVMMSGSSREGLRFKSSDMDVMYWFCEHKLISDLSQASLYDKAIHSIILMEDADTPPGFVKLQLLTPPRGDFISSSAVPVNGRVYISSLLWQQETFSKVNKMNGRQRVTSHGPCANDYVGAGEIDTAVCIAGIHWPRLARPWIERCLRYSWPPALVLANTLKNGYHCVPVGSKIVSSGNLLEWRLSFSQAELKLVSAMNHTQFLVYGLLKIFLKEVVNHDVEEPLLCSYFLKTTVFWMIQEGSVEWRPDNLLHYFWKCFKYLIHCVYRGAFPNFFLPENNMFINKVVGAARSALLKQLYHYYQMGVSCLLLSPNLRSILEPVLRGRPLVICRSVVDLDITAIKEIFDFGFNAGGTSQCFILLSTVDKLSRLSLLPYQMLTLQYGTAEILVRTAFILANDASYSTCKDAYKVDEIACNMLKMASRIGTVSHPLYLASYYYRTGRYDEAIRVAYLTKERLLQPYIMVYSGNVNRRRYRETVGSLSPIKKMITVWADCVRFYNTIYFIKELVLEQEVRNASGELPAYVPPLVMADMLLVLSHFRLGNVSQSLQSMRDLQSLLLHDDGRYVPLRFRDLSWQILGICQHVVGDLHGALHSYQEALKEDQHHNIQVATENRIAFLERQLHGNRKS
jgi:hypothetical protein